MKIALLHVPSSDAADAAVDAGGCGQWAAQMARQLREAGHEVDRLAAPEDAAALRQAGRQPDIVVAQGLAAAAAALALQRDAGVPFVASLPELQGAAVVNADAPQAEGGRDALLRRIVDSADALVATSPAAQDALVQSHGAARARTHCVPCGFDPQEFAPMSRMEARRALGLDPDEFIVLHRGSGSPCDGTETALRALALLPGGMRPRLAVAGGAASDRADEAGAGLPAPCPAPEIGRLQALAAALGVAARVRFVAEPAREPLRALYCAANVFTAVPWCDPLGITALEAMACGTPVVGSDRGAIRHVVVDTLTGLLVPPRDPQALAARLQCLHDQPALARAMGLAGVRRAQMMFTWAHAALQLATVCERVMARDTQPSAAPRRAGLSLVSSRDGLLPWRRGLASMRLV